MAEWDNLTHQEWADNVNAARAAIHQAHQSIAATGGLMGCRDVAAANQILDGVELAVRLAKRYDLPIPWLGDGWCINVIGQSYRTTGRTAP